MKNKKLAQSITKRAKADIFLRKKVVRGVITKKEWTKLQNVDKQNTLFVRQTIEKHGWPTFDLIGKRASQSFWLLVQHADKNLKLQKRCLELLRVVVENGQASPKNLAYLIDRILTSENKKQIYGSQYSRVGNKLVPKPIKDKKKVNKLRKEVGLEPLGTATKSINKECQGYLKKK